MDILNARYVPALHVIPAATLFRLDPIQRHRIGFPLPRGARAGWLAVVFGHEGKPLPMAWGETPAAAHAQAMMQYAGTSPTLQAHYRERIQLLPLTADEASEWAEWFAAPWGAA